MTDAAQEALVKRVARELAPLLEGGRTFDQMPPDRLALRKWSREAMCSVNDATQDDARQAARTAIAAIQPELDALRAELAAVKAKGDARDKLAALQAKSDRTMTDHGRLLWRDDVEGVCHSPDLCFEHSDTVRCGPCAIKQAEESGIATADNLPNLPEVSRLNREIAALQAHADALAGYGEHTSTCDIMTHGVWSDPTPCTCGWGATFRAYEAFKAGEPT